MKSICRLKGLVLILLGLVSAALLTAQVTIDPPSRSFTKNGGAGAVLTFGSGAWTATTADAWLNITPRTSGTSGESYIYVVSSNFSADTRIGSININGNTHSVSQSGYAATLTPSSTIVDLDGDSGSVSITVDAGVSWSATSNTDWISVSPSSGISSGTVTFSVESNPGVTTRNGSITIAGQTFSVTQTGTDVNLSPKEVIKAYSSDIIQIQVTALGSTNWTVTANNPWISVVDDGNGFGDSQITLAVGTNPSFLERTGTVSIGSAALTIIQAGTPNPVLDIIPDEATADPVGAFGNAAILATPDAPWTAESEEPWIIIANGESGAGNGNIQYVVSANPNLTERSGRIRVSPPVYAPKVDLSKQLFCHIKTGSTNNEGRQDRSGWNRDLSGSLANQFDGTTPLVLQGQPFSKNDDALTIALWFELGEVDSVNRLLDVERAVSSHTALYVNAANQLVFGSASETLVTTLTVEADVQYQVVISVDDLGETSIYAARRDGSLSDVGSMAFTAAPFPKDYVTPLKISLGSSSLPNPGNLTNAFIDDFRLYGRALSSAEAGALFTNVGTSTPYGSFPQKGDPQNVLVEYNLQGQALVAGGSQAPVAFNSGYEPSFHSTITSFSTSETVVKSLDISPNRFIEEIQSSGDGARNNSNDQMIYWRYKFYYTDGGISYTAMNSKRGDGEVTVLNANPIPSKAVSRIEVLARIGLNFSYLNYELYWSKIKYLSETAQLTDWSPENDHFGLSQSALKGTSNSRLVLRNHQSSFPQSSATYNFWLRFDALGSTVPVFTRASYGTNQLSLSLMANASLQMAYGGTTRVFQPDFEVGEWYMLTITGEYGGATKLYVNGAEIGNTPDFSSYRFGLNSTLQDLAIGGWNGAIDYAGFYDGALSSAQVRAIYDTQKFDYQYHTVTQSTVSPIVTPAASSFAASGGSGSADLTIAGNVNWSASSDSGWISLTSAASGIGSTTTSYSVAANPTVYQRQGAITLAGETVTITQAGLSANLDFDEFVFGTDGGSDWIDVFPEANGSWEAVSNDSWLTIAIGASGTGSGSVLIVADPYAQTSQSRTGTIEVAGQTIYITQRGYQLSVSPQVAQIGSNSGAGEFGVAAPISSVWEAITTQPWITITGSSTGIGNGTLRYTVAENTTGGSRSGRIIVSGTEYTITQDSSLQVNAVAGTGGSVLGAGNYETNATASLTALASNGYVFSHWTGDGDGSNNPLSLNVDSDKDVTAHFIPDSAASSFEASGKNSVLSNPNTYGLYEENQLRAMAVGRPFLSVDTETNKVTVGFGLKESSNLSTWDDVMIQSSATFIRNGQIEVELSVDADAKFYQISVGE